LILASIHRVGFVGGVYTIQPVFHDQLDANPKGFPKPLGFYPYLGDLELPLGFPVFESLRIRWLVSSFPSLHPCSSPYDGNPRSVGKEKLHILAAKLHINAVEILSNPVIVKWKRFHLHINNHIQLKRIVSN
jgi:hypothetical protein